MLEPIPIAEKNHIKAMHGVYTNNLGLYLDEHIYRWNQKTEGLVYELLIKDIVNQYLL